MAASGIPDISSKFDFFIGVNLKAGEGISSVEVNTTILRVIYLS
jgi:hypothetical protein